jgi:hypothetical protein
MSDQTTGPDGASGDAGSAPDYQAKYNGLQAAFQKRQNEWAQREQDFETERADYEAKASKLAEYEARDQATREEDEADAAYEQRKRLDPAFTPERHGMEPRGLAGTDRDDGSAEYAYGQMAKALGTTVDKKSWP